MFAQLRDRDITAVVRLAADAGDLPRDAAIRRRFIADGLRRLVGGATALVVELSGQTGTLAAGESSILQLNACGSCEQLVRAAILTGTPPDPVAPSLHLGERRFITVLRRSVVSDARWYRSEQFQTLRRPTGIDESLYARVALADGSVLALTIQREIGDAPFADRERALLDLFHSAAAVLYATASPPTLARDARIASLPHRLRSVALGLLEGKSEKVVAASLGISAHTVHDYVKGLYRRFGVASRGEFLAMFVG